MLRGEDWLEGLGVFKESEGGFLFLGGRGLMRGMYRKSAGTWKGGGGGCFERLTYDGDSEGQLVLSVVQTHGRGAEGYGFVGLKHFSA